MVEVDFIFVIAAMIMIPFGAFGIFTLFRKIMELAFVRMGNVRMLLFTPSRMIKSTWGKPQKEDITTGKSTYKFGSEYLYRNGGTPTILYNQDSIEPVDPLKDQTSKLSTSRLSEMQIRWFNLGVISTLKQEQLVKILLIVCVVAAVGAAGLSFINMQSMSMMQGSLAGQIGGIPDAVTSRLPATASPAQNMSVLG